MTLDTQIEPLPGQSEDGQRLEFLENIVGGLDGELLLFEMGHENKTRVTTRHPLARWRMTRPIWTEYLLWVRVNFRAPPGR